MKMWAWAALGLGAGGAAYWWYRRDRRGDPHSNGGPHSELVPFDAPPDSGALRAAGALGTVGVDALIQAAIESCPVTFDTGRAEVPPTASAFCQQARDQINANPDLLAQLDPLASADWSNATLLNGDESDLSIHTNPPMSGMSYPGLVWRWNG